MPAVATVQPAHTTHNSFLKKVGHLGFECFSKVLPFVMKQAQNAEPVVDLLFPVQGGLFSTVVNSICMTEVSAAQAANNATGGEKKLQAVIDVVGPQLSELANQHGLAGSEAEAAIKRYVQAVFDLLDGPTKSSSTGASASV